MTFQSRPLSALALAAAFTLLAPGAHALDRCKVKQNKRTGLLEVSAQGVSSFLQFGYTADNTYSNFFNAAECVGDGSARGCQVADPATREASVPPPFCEVHLRDAETSCVARLKRCTPGVRPVCPPDMEQLGGDCIEKNASGGLQFYQAIQQCAARGRNLCSLDQLQRCDSTDLSKDRPASCGDWTDGGANAWLWTSSSLPLNNLNIYDTLVLYGGDNVTRVRADGDAHEFFCCAPLGSQ